MSRVLAAITGLSVAALATSAQAVGDSVTITYTTVAPVPLSPAMLGILGLGMASLTFMVLRHRQMKGGLAFLLAASLGLASSLSADQVRAGVYEQFDLTSQGTTTVQFAPGGTTFELRNAMSHETEILTIDYSGYDPLFTHPDSGCDVGSKLEANEVCLFKVLYGL